MGSLFNEMMEEISEKDIKIAELEAKIELARNTSINTNKMDIIHYQAEVLELKQQIKEKDQAIEGLQEINQSLGQTCNNDAKEIERLREQLAEKDELYRTCCEQCERIKDKLGIITSYNQDLQNEILDKHKTNEKLKKSQNQTAIDELEKVISYLSDRTDVINDELNNFDRDEISVRFAVKKRLITDIFYVIDQQIKSLKGDK